MEDGFGLSTVAGLLAVVAAFALGYCGGLEGRSISEGAVGAVGQEAGRRKGRRWKEKGGGERSTLPALYCVTLCWVCFLQSLPLQ